MTYTLTFTLKANIYGPITNGKIINQTFVDVNNLNGIEIFLHQSLGDPATGTIVETFEER